MINVFSLLAVATLLITGVDSIPVVPSSMPRGDHLPTVSLTQMAASFEEAYQTGYGLGLQQGETYRADHLDYSPDILGLGNIREGENEQRAIAGYKAGFLAGFHDGYYNQSNLAINEVEEFEDGYNQGYLMGEKDGHQARLNGLGYHPHPNSSVVWRKQYQSGYLVGYWQGFDQGWQDE